MLACVCVSARAGGGCWCTWVHGGMHARRARGKHASQRAPEATTHPPLLTTVLPMTRETMGRLLVVRGAGCG